MLEYVLSHKKGLDLLMLTMLDMGKDRHSPYLQDFIEQNNQLILARIKLGSYTLILLYPIYFYTDFVLYRDVQDQIFAQTLTGIHLTGLLMSIAYLLFYSWQKRKQRSLSPRRTAIIINSTIFLYLFMGASASINSLRLIGNIDAYVIVMICVAAMFPIRPKHFLSILLVIHAFFLTGLQLAETGTYALISKEINSTIAVGFSFLLSFSFYSYRWKHFEDKRKLEENEQNLRKLIDMNPFPLFLSRLSDGEILLYNKRAAEYFAFSPLERATLDETKLFQTPEDKHSFLQLLHQHGMVKNTIMEHQLSSGHSRWAMASSETIDYADEKCMLLGVTDITELKKMEAELVRHASLDMHTGVLNRITGMERLKRALERAQDEDLAFIVCFVDVNNLKFVNDTFGHAEGDELIQIVCNAIKSHIGENDMLFRYGGDEFIILFDHKQLHEVQTLWKHLHRDFSQASIRHEKPYPISVSHGLFQYHSRMQITPEEMIKLADAEMYRNKRRSKS
ncbi:diguanylate cyclase domain-containing protein [Brevibacillus sp. B_LB10_24]|uniref:sensor domain-containing diguanylate cyclase n=1 Tax=Brevibacillus sp. B_LB10_24 TaxID=3380645 RepID=UPI0038BABD50